MEKLKTMQMIPQVIDIVVVHLIKQDYLNEERFAKALARGKFRIKKWGKNRIVNVLKTKGISKYNIENALKEIDDTEYLNTLDELIKKQMVQNREENTYKKMQKVSDYLLYRGWESHLIYEKLKDITS